MYAKSFGAVILSSFFFVLLPPGKGTNADTKQIPTAWLPWGTGPSDNCLHQPLTNAKGIESIALNGVKWKLGQVTPGWRSLKLRVVMDVVSSGCCSIWFECLVVHFKDFFPIFKKIDTPKSNERWLCHKACHFTERHPHSLGSWLFQHTAMAVHRSLTHKNLIQKCM